MSPAIDPDLCHLRFSYNHSPCQLHRASIPEQMLRRVFLLESPMIVATMDSAIRPLERGISICPF